MPLPPLELWRALLHEGAGRLAVVFGGGAERLERQRGVEGQVKLLADELGEAKARETAKTSELQSRENIERMRGDTTKSIAAINAQVKLYEIKAEAAGTLGELESAEAMTLLEIEELRRPNPPIEREPAPVAGTI